MFRLLALLVILVPAVAAAQDSRRGQALAERWCAGCHVVDRTATMATVNGLPTFPGIAAKQQTTETLLRSYMTAEHGRMPNFALGAREQDDLIAYIFSLRAR